MESTEVAALLERWRGVRASIAQAAERAERSPKEVALLAVSKRHPAAAVRALYEAGQRDFGESYVQELSTKREQLADLVDLRWHMIGHVQRNKAKVVAAAAALVQSVDSVRLASELGTRAVGRANPLGVLVQVNVSEEPQKSGCAAADLGPVLDAVEEQRSLRLRGLMMIASRQDSAGASRAPFDALARLRDQFGGAERLPELSMGMSGDWGVAIAAGSTCVRVGTAIFGSRG